MDTIDRKIHALQEIASKLYLTGTTVQVVLTKDMKFKEMWHVWHDGKAQQAFEQIQDYVSELYQQQHKQQISLFNLMKRSQGE